MKIQSEFYLEELLCIMRGINLQIEENGRGVVRANRMHTILSFLTPWNKRRLDENLFNLAMESIRLTGVLSNTQAKIMESQGRDEYGNFVSLDEMMSEEEED